MIRGLQCIVVALAACASKTETASTVPPPRAHSDYCVDGQIYTDHGPPPGYGHLKPGDFERLPGGEACRGPDEARPRPREAAAVPSVAIEAEVTAYQGGAMWEHYDDGSFASFDATSVTVVAPGEYAGKTLSFFHDTQLAVDSPWRQIGKRIRFSIARESLTEHLANKRTLFTGAARELMPAGDG